jgi:hypothetical protein
MFMLYDELDRKVWEMEGRTCTIGPQIISHLKLELTPLVQVEFKLTGVNFGLRDVSWRGSRYAPGYDQRRLARPFFMRVAFSARFERSDVV